MSRYVDADAIKIPSTSVDMFENCRNCNLLDEFQVREIIDSAPTIDIVRCVECRRVREDGGHANCNGYLYCRKWKILVDEDGYCSWGERENDE